MRSPTKGLPTGATRAVHYYCTSELGAILFDVLLVAKVLETTMYGCVVWFPNADHYKKATLLPADCTLSCFTGDRTHNACSCVGMP